MTFPPDLFLYFIFPFHLPFVLSSSPCIDCRVIAKCQQILQQGASYWSVHTGNFPPVPRITATPGCVSSASEVMLLSIVDYYVLVG